MGQLPQVVSEKDLDAINKALANGYEVHIRATKQGVRISAEKSTVQIIRNDKN